MTWERVSEGDLRSRRTDGAVFMEVREKPQWHSWRICVDALPVVYGRADTVEIAESEADEMLATLRRAFGELTRNQEAA